MDLTSVDINVSNYKVWGLLKVKNTAGLKIQVNKPTKLLFVYLNNASSKFWTSYKLTLILPRRNGRVCHFWTSFSSPPPFKKSWSDWTQGMNHPFHPHWLFSVLGKGGGEKWIWLACRRKAFAYMLSALWIKIRPPLFPCRHEIIQ